MPVFRHFLLIATAGLTCLAAAQQINPRRDFVSTGKNAYMLFQPEFVCGPKVNEISWSQDGDHLAVIREETGVTPQAVIDVLESPTPAKNIPQLDPEQQLVIWSAVSQKASIWMRLRTSEGSLNRLNWIAGSSALLVEVDPPDNSPAADAQTTLLLLRANAQARVVARFKAWSIEVDPSPFRSLVALLDRQFEQRPESAPGTVQDSTTRTPDTVRFLGMDGEVGQPMQLPALLSIPHWSADGNFYVHTVTRLKPRGVRRTWYVANRSTGQFEVAKAPMDAEDLFDPGAQKELIVSNWNAKISRAKIGVPAPTVTLAATNAKEDDFAVVTTDGTQGGLSPKLNGVSYEAQGSLMVRPMLKLSYEAYLRAKENAERLAAINDAKQAALGLIMYSADYDDNMLANSAGWQDQLMPYIKNQDILDNFQYTFAGGLTTGIADPSSTVLGYVNGPNGRAIAYLDGHVNWVPNP